jgi:hypothetical protein
MTIDWTKPIQTSSGGKARVLATDFKGRGPVVVAYELANREEYLALVSLDGIGHYPAQGLNFKNCPTKVSRWINIYPMCPHKSTHTSYSTKENADKGAGSSRIHCIEVSWEE